MSFSVSLHRLIRSSVMRCMFPRQTPAKSRADFSEGNLPGSSGVAGRAIPVSVRMREKLP